MRMKTIFTIFVTVFLCVVSARTMALQGTPVFSVNPTSMDMGR